MHSKEFVRAPMQATCSGRWGSILNFRGRTAGVGGGRARFDELEQGNRIISAWEPYGAFIDVWPFLIHNRVVANEGPLKEN